MRFKIIFFGLVFERILALSISCSFCIKNKNGPFGFILFTSRQLKSILFMWSWSCFHFGFCCDTWSHGNCARKCFFFSSTIQQTTTIESFSRCLSRLKENMRKLRMWCHAISLVSNWSKNLNNPSSFDLHAPCFYSVPFDSRLVLILCFILTFRVWMVRLHTNIIFIEQHIFIILWWIDKYWQLKKNVKSTNVLIYCSCFLRQILEFVVTL